MTQEIHDRAGALSATAQARTPWCEGDARLRMAWRLRGTITCVLIAVMRPLSAGAATRWSDSGRTGA
jgi:hypothetical protein